MKMKPLISVITTVWNCEKYILDSVTSVLNQTFGDFEYIIVNDGSSDGTLKILTDLSRDKRVKLISFSTNIGRVAALNKALEEAAGEFIALQDADDVSLPSRFEVQKEFMMMNPDYVLSGTDIEEIDPSGRHLSFPAKPVSDGDLKFFLLFKCTLTNPTTMFRKDVVEANGIKYLPVYAHAEDFAFISELIRHGKVYNIPEVLLKYRRHPSNNSKVNFSQLNESSINIAMSNVSQLGLDLDSSAIQRIRALLSSKGISKTHVLADVNSMLDVLELYMEKSGECQLPHVNKLLKRIPGWLGRKNVILKGSYKQALRRARALEKKTMQETGSAEIT